MDSRISLRRATLADIDTIVHHRRAMFHDMGDRDSAVLERMDMIFQDWLGEKMRTGDYHNWFLCEDGRIVAGAGVWMITDYPPNPDDTSTRRGLILNVYTEPEYRRKGLARQLMGTVMEWCREQRLRTVLLHASDQARPLYESLGFSQTSEMRYKFVSRD